MTGTAIQAIKALKGGSVSGVPTMHAMVKASNKMVWHGVSKNNQKWSITKNASNMFTVKM